MILHWILGNTLGRCGMDASGSSYGPMAGCFEFCNIRVP